MKYTLTINSLNDKVKAVLDIIKQTEGIDFEEVLDFELSKEYKHILDERLENHLNESSASYSWKEVKERLSKKK